MLTFSYCYVILSLTKLNSTAKEVIATQYEYRKLIGRIIEKYGTRKEFAKEVGLSENSMSLKLNGKTGFSRDDMIQWGKLQDIDVAEFGSYFFT